MKITTALCRLFFGVAIVLLVVGCQKPNGHSAGQRAPTGGSNTGSVIDAAPTRQQVSVSTNTNRSIVTFTLDAPVTEITGQSGTLTYAPRSALPAGLLNAQELLAFLDQNPGVGQNVQGTLTNQNLRLGFPTGRFVGFITVSTPGVLYFTDLVEFTADNGGSGGGPNGGPPAPTDPVIVLRELDGFTGNAPVTFGHVFRQGQYQDGNLSVYLEETQQELPAQIDVLRHHDDGSIRHALISFILPVQPQGNYTIRLLAHPTVPPAPFQLAYTPAAFDVRMDLTGAASVSGKLRDITAAPEQCQAAGNLPTDRAYWRFNGRIMKECVVWGKMRGANGIPDPDLDFSIRVRTYSGFNGATFQYVVENTHSKLSPGNQNLLPQAHFFTAAQLNAGASNNLPIWQFSQPLNLFVGTRFMREGKWGVALPEIEKQWRIEDLVRGRLVDMLNFRNNPTDFNGNIINYNYVNVYRHGRPLSPEPNGAQTYIRQYMWDVGDRDDIGTEPMWAKVHLATMNRDALTLNKAVEASELGFNFEIHYRKSMDNPGAPTGHIPGGPVGLNCGPLQNPQPATSEWVHLVPSSIDPNTGAPGTADTAHQPRTGFLTYALTGELYFLEEMQFWYFYNVAGTYPHNCHIHGPARAVAWSGIRSPSDVDFLTPDNDPKLPYVRQVYSNIIDYLMTQTVGQPAGLFPKVMPMFANSYGLWQPGAATWVNATRGLPWQYSWVAWAMELMALRSYGDPRINQIRDWIFQFPMDLYTVENDPSQAYVDPSGHAWTYPAWDSQAYLIAYQFYPQMQSCFPNYPPSNSTQNANDFLVGPLTRFQTYGELYYWTLTNTRHEGYPQPNWCPADGNQWNPSNGLTNIGISTYNWHGYGGNPMAAAAATAVIDSDPATRSTAMPKALQVLAINQGFWPPRGFNLIPFDPN